ncbi:hypothetical protein JHU04_002960 [Brenneria sp. 4F2]|nr:hypothetical protein [Brenneria bubanii]
MVTVWKGMQPLRVASGWSIDVNNFYSLEPSSENRDWFCGSVLISGNNNKGLCFDSKFEPEGDPNGEFVLDFIQLFTSKQNEHFIGTKKTKSRL